MVETVTILGATGSIGQNALDIISAHKDAFKIKCLTANSNVKLLIEQALKFEPEYVAISDETKNAELCDALKALPNCEILAGADAAEQIAKIESDIVISAIVGFAGLLPTMAAVNRGAKIGLANKESLVCAGEIIMQQATQSGAKIIPVDSEHSAIFQVFDFAHPESVEKVTLTASGGPFREYAYEQMAGVTAAQAVKHPNWNMGAKISIDSATMMNKGLELIEAYNLFPIDINQLEVIVHPESIVHSLVHYKDGSVLAQAGTPDMRVPISYALGYPERLRNDSVRLNLAEIGQLNFEKPDLKRFPCLALAQHAMKEGGSVPIILNAANEIAVDGFLSGQIKFLEIAEIVEKCILRNNKINISELSDVFNVDCEVRSKAIELCRLAA
ncbi:MAG: 1-deoxy-D-xylulose-5-phosphate reductoisomerase [Alphaproteobacteria bacterium CG11_big_fil_rev_8_21_14_0_20_44_7]|nr:MAG: 1-deoxy-D-xylulose-5-phosphate reductoisomerase [Alphaproteobacteria bacterium CG11_big_fil_rev_8_21_14_0_20_44_7]